jgi:hypothetical protein
MVLSMLSRTKAGAKLCFGDFPPGSTKRSNKETQITSIYLHDLKIIYTIKYVR